MVIKNVTEVQIWILTGLLGVAMTILGIFSYSMYNTFENLQKSVYQISNDITAIKIDQKYQIVETTQLNLKYNMLHDKVTELELKIERLR